MNACDAGGSGRLVHTLWKLCACDAPMKFDGNMQGYQCQIAHADASCELTIELLCVTAYISRTRKQRRKIYCVADVSARFANKENDGVARQQRIEGKKTIFSQWIKWIAVSARIALVARRKHFSPHLCTESMGLYDIVSHMQWNMK